MRPNWKQFIRCCATCWLLIYRRKQYKEHISVFGYSHYAHERQTHLTDNRQIHKSRQQSAVFTGSLWCWGSSGLFGYYVFFLILSLCHFFFVSRFRTRCPNPTVAAPQVYFLPFLPLFFWVYFWIIRCRRTTWFHWPSQQAATAHCSSLWPRTSSPSPSCSGTKSWSAAPRGWWQRRSSSSCLWWWTCSQRTLSPALSAGLWCKVFVSSCLGGRANRRAGAPPRLWKKRTKDEADRLGVGMSQIWRKWM